MAVQKLTPMFEQYMSIKAEYPDALLFYRMGDFYELFFEDAETAARELQIALTSRNPNAELKAPMCGVPHHSVDGYLNQLLEKGYKVAICDQIEDPKQAKGLVKRAVTRVLTPGTVVEDSNLQAKDNNYLAALYFSTKHNAGGLAWVDVSTGEWSGLQSKKEIELWQWAVKMAPRELLLPQEQSIPSALAQDFTQVSRVPFRAYFDYAAAKNKIEKEQSGATLTVLDLEDKKELTQSVGALLAYLIQTQKRELGHLGQFQPLNLSKHLLIDEVTERNLELFKTLDGRSGKGTLWQAIDRTITPMGGRLLRERIKHPWRELPPIERTLDCVTFFFKDDSLRENTRTELDSIYDLERLSTRIFLGRGSPKDFVALRESLTALPRIREIFADIPKDGQPPSLASLLKNWDDLADIGVLLERALVDSPPPVITEGGLFKPGYHAELDELLDLSEHGENKLNELLQKERDAHELPKLKLGFNRVFGYYFELSRVQSGNVPEHFIRRQTLTNSERFTTPELKELEERLVYASDQRKTLEYTLFQELRDTISAARPRLAFMAGALAGLDYWQGLADAARRAEWTRPDLHTGLNIQITAGRHPVVEAVQGAANFIPNDLTMTDDGKILVITGPNMAGKSTVLRQAAIIVLLAQIGSYVPARKADIGIADRIFSRVGASDNLARGQSTFMVEMIETARILRQGGKRSLIILDEIGRGTSTFDGMALAWAVVEELAKRGHGASGMRTLFATHYHELTALEGAVSGVRNFNIAVKEWAGDIVFLRRLVPGPSDRSYGIEVAKLAGVPKAVVTRAKEILHELEKKAADAENRFIEIQTAQTMLPGLALTPSDDTQCVGDDAEPHPLLDELGRLELDTLTPLDALNVLNSWKAKWG